MKRFLLILMAAVMISTTAACSEQQAPGSQTTSGDTQKTAETSGAETQETNEPGGEKTAKLIFDFSVGSASPSNKEETYTSDKEITDEELVEAMSEMTGLDFFVTISEVDGRKIVDWAENSTLIAGLDGRAQKDDFHFFDNISLNWFMMNSLWRTLGGEEVYYTMDGGKELTIPNFESEPIQTFPSDSPYMGSLYYYNLINEGGSVDFNTFVDSEIGVTLYYPTTFSAEASVEAGSVYSFASLVDNTKLRFLLNDNTYGETKEELLEHYNTFSEIGIYNDAVIGWGTDLNQETGETAPVVNYMYVIGTDYIATVGLLCESDEQAKEWYQKMINGEVYIEY